MECCLLLCTLECNIHYLFTAFSLSLSHQIHPRFNIMDIRNFFKPPATPTAVSKDALPAKKVLVTSPSLLTSTSATKAKVPATKSVVATKKRKRPASAAVPSAADLKRAKKIVAAAAKAKKEKEKDVLPS